MTTAHANAPVQAKLKQIRMMHWLLTASLLTLLMLIGIGSVQAATASRASAFEYDPVSGLLTKEIIEPDDANLCLVTSYSYDAFGNKVSATTRNCNGSAGSVPGTNTEAATPVSGSNAVIEARTSSSTYDTQGRFPISSSNALGQTETKTWNSNFGTVASLTGPNGLATNWTYDTFGRKLTEFRADGTSSNMSYALCGTGITCPTASNGVVPKYAITSSQAGASTSRNYYDQLNRVVISETQDKDGNLIYTQAQYDHLGRAYMNSRPYKAGATPVWTTTSYDLIGRAISTTAPDNTIGTIAYNGYTTTATNAKNQTKTEVRNSQGQLKTVTDVNGQTLTYAYDAYGNLTTTTDAQGNITSITYDKRGRKVAMSDPDQGVWSYSYDALGQLKQQTDAKNQVVSFSYDKLGRMTSRAEPDLISTWAYDTCDATLNPAGKCIGKPVKESTDNGYVRTYLYDSYGRATAELDNVDTGYGVTKNFDSYGRVATLAYPSGNGASFSTYNVYSASGHLSEVREAGTDKLFWQAGATDSEGRIAQTTYGNTITNTTTFNPLTGRISQVSAGVNNSVSNQSFVYDTLGNLTQRYDAATGLNEAFGYDNLNRLTSTSAQAGAGPLTQTTVTYDTIGNITSKSDVGTYTYASLKADGSARPHAVSSIMMNDGVTQYAAYTYDENGNQTTGAGRTLNWNSWNMPSNITGSTVGKSTPDGTTSSSFQFVYNASHERVKETLPNGTVIYNISPRVDTGIHVEKRVKTNGEISYNYSLYAGSMPFGSHTVTKATPTSTATMTNRYYHTDHLGSIIAITDDVGNVVERRSYDAWGKRRNSNGTAMTNAFVTPEERHGFTGHEELDDVGLIHMNGRLYDPVTGRFLSADPIIQYPDDMQSYNRYSYINNNPLSATDPSGHSFLGGLAGGIVGFFTGGPVGAVAGFAIGAGALNNPLIRTVASIAVAYYTGYYAGLYGASAVASGAAGGFAGGLVAGRGDLRAAIMGAMTGAAMGFVGDTWDINTKYWQNVAGHAAVGCGSAAMGGGNCGSGALAGGFSGAAAPKIPGSWGVVGGAMASAVIGGTASVLGGGKFENGAMTGAFGYLFNYCSHGGNCTTKLEKNLWDWMPGYKVGTCINNGDCTAADWATATGGTAVAIAAGVEVKGAGAAADFFAGSNYTNKVLGQMGNDLYHGFPLTVDAMAAEAGQVTRIVGGDGAQYLRLQVDGAVNGAKGTFEYIKDSLGNINHRLFRPNQ